ncbi:uncharacterized protein LOC113368073 [Ctenocephalides felis]|uniref:uncharacterized protein LOC113368073 n=1 Tax=Ctenocephalides felis TaxID=7515 RepID=UPI000E6E5082|nr:uncharacterized protein LOC113368073 [Ctenocephalides felis]
MLERFLKLAPYVAQITISDANAPVIVSAAEVETIRELSNLLQPLEYITRELSGEYYITVSKVIPLINCLLAQLRAIQPKSRLCVKLKQALIDTASKRFLNLEENLPMAIATLLDPRFKNFHFKNANAASNAMNALRNQICLDNSTTSLDIDVTPDSFDFWQLHKKIASEKKKGNKRRDEIDLYLNNPVTPLTSNPIESWEDMKEIFPDLYNKFREYATIIATSVPAERLFFEAGTIMTERRNRLKPENLNMLLFLAGRPEEEWFH